MQFPVLELLWLLLQAISRSAPAPAHPPYVPNPCPGTYTCTPRLLPCQQQVGYDLGTRGAAEPLLPRRSTASHSGRGGGSTVSGVRGGGNASSGGGGGSGANGHCPDALKSQLLTSMTGTATGKRQQK